MTAPVTAGSIRLGVPLTARELEVLSLVADGLSNEDIGRALRIAPTTVRTHLDRIGTKLGCGDRAGMVGAAFRSGQMRFVRSERDVELDDRKMQVLIRVARGLSNDEIAAELVMSAHTVKSRLRALFKVLGVGSRAALVKAALECGALTLVPRQRSGPVSNRATVTGPSEPLAAWQMRNAPHSARAAVSVALRPSPGAVTPEAKGAR